MTDYKEVKLVKSGEDCVPFAPHKADKDVVDNLALTKASKMELEDAIDEIDSKITDVIPIGFGRWSDVPLGENWVKVTDSFVSSNDYPVLYNLLLDILAGTRSLPYMNVYNFEDAVSMELEDDNNANDNNCDKLARAYIVDVTNNSFRFPRYTLSHYSVGNSDTIVISNENGYGGKTMISASGHYFQFGNMIRLGIG